MSDNLVGEFLSLDTAKRLHKEKENKIDKNILEANIKLVDENKQLKANWDKLKEWLESNWEESQDIWFVKIINKMREIEQGSDK